MNFEEFLDKLSESKDKIKWLSKRSIRGIYLGKCVCPITGLHSYINNKNPYPVDEFEMAGLELGMDEKLIEVIVNATDGIKKFDKNVRGKILEVLNLTEN